MSPQDRIEVRDMLHDILSGWQASTIAREELTNLGLKNIEEHLARLNGSVAKHEGIINENLPHTTANCPQKGTIEEIRDDMITGRAMKKFIVTSIASTGALFTILFIIYQIFIR